MSEVANGRPFSNGVVCGPVKYVRTEDEAKDIVSGDIVLSDYLPPPFAGMVTRAAGVALVGIEANHAVSYFREIWKPGMLLDSLPTLDEGTVVTLDCDRGVLTVGQTKNVLPEILPLKSSLQTTVYLQLGVPRMASRAAKLGADGVALFRTNLMIQEQGMHPLYYFENGREDQLKRLLTNGIRTIAGAFSAHPVWVRMMDFDSSELNLYRGRPDLVEEPNPLLGLRGLSWELYERRVLRLELSAVKEALESGFENLGVLFPLVRTVSEYEQAREVVRSIGLRPHEDLKLGVVFETPSAALQIDDFVSAGLDFAFVGINDLTQYTLACDRANPRVAKVYNPTHPSVLRLVKDILDVCSGSGVETTMNYLQDLDPYLEDLIVGGLGSLTLQVQQLESVGNLIDTIESKIRENASKM